MSECVSTPPRKRNQQFSLLKRRRNMAELNNNKYVQPAIPRFDGHYDHWAKIMENFLRSKEYWHLVENTISVVTMCQKLNSRPWKNKS